MRRAGRLLIPLLCAIGAVVCSRVSASGPVPPPATDAPLAKTATPRVAVVAGGCFWGIQAVFAHVRGVTRAVAGYAGGDAATAHYEMVGTGRTGHAESVEITYDASIITYGQLLQVFFSVAHNPTERNRQGPDVGTEYRSVIFFGDADQQRLARTYIAQIDAARVFSAPVATEVSALTRFYPAEAYHQDYALHHPDDFYIIVNDAPKVERLRTAFPNLFK